MFRFTTVRRDPDGEFSVITRNGNPYDVGTRYAWITNAILHAAVKNRAVKYQIVDPYQTMQDAERSRAISKRDALVWAKLDFWQVNRPWVSRFADRAVDSILFPHRGIR